MVVDVLCLHVVMIKTFSKGRQTSIFWGFLNFGYIGLEGASGQALNLNSAI